MNFKFIRREKQEPTDRDESEELWELSDIYELINEAESGSLFCDAEPCSYLPVEEKQKLFSELCSQVARLLNSCDGLELEINELPRSGISSVRIRLEYGEMMAVENYCSFYRALGMADAFDIIPCDEDSFVLRFSVYRTFRKASD